MTEVAERPGPGDPSLPRPVRAVTLVIPVRNEESSLPVLLDSIRAQTRIPDEILLVDGGSGDVTVSLARALTANDPRFRVIEAGDATPGRGRNVGITAARSEWIALTDAGIRLEPDWLERLTEAAESDPDVDIVYGNFEPVEGSFFEHCAGLAYPPPKRARPGGLMRGPFIASSLVRREVWEAVGGFPDLRAAEDLIFMERAGSRFKVGWAPGATVWWQLQPSLSKTYRKFALYSKHNVWAGRQHDWHHGVARLYAAALAWMALGVVWSHWLLAIPLVSMAARTAKSIWERREGRGLAWAFHPARFALVGVILLAIDLAMFAGWFDAWLSRRTSGRTTTSAS